MEGVDDAAYSSRGGQEFTEIQVHYRPEAPCGIYFAADHSGALDSE
jgi:hypothetical protein